MLILIQGGRVVDPTAGRDGIGDVWIEDGHVVAASERKPDRTIDASGCVVMAGGVEVHSHIAGGNVVMSRLLLPDLYASEAAPEGHPFAHAGGSAAWIGAITRGWATPSPSSRRCRRPTRSRRSSNSPTSRCSTAAPLR